MSGLVVSSRISSVFVARPVQLREVPEPTESPTPLRAQLPVTICCFLSDARTDDNSDVSEVGELLREYERLVEAVRAMGGFHED